MNRVNSLGESDSAVKPQRKLSQQALSIVDDVEFLQALEQVRTLHKEQMAQQEAEASKIQRMAKLGMAPGNKKGYHHPAGNQRGRSRGPTLDQEESSTNSGNAVISSNGSIQPKKSCLARTASADARLGGKSRNEIRAELMGSPQSNAVPRDSLLAGDSTPSAKAAALTLREGLREEMGQAAGNDDDWKKEVKSLVSNFNSHADSIQVANHKHPFFCSL